MLRGRGRALSRHIRDMGPGLSRLGGGRQMRGTLIILVQVRQTQEQQLRYIQRLYPDIISHHPGLFGIGNAKF